MRTAAGQYTRAGAGTQVQRSPRRYGAGELGEFPSTRAVEIGRAIDDGDVVVR
jgi:hypothetical protein